MSLNTEQKLGIGVGGKAAPLGVSISAAVLVPVLVLAISASSIYKKSKLLRLAFLVRGEGRLFRLTFNLWGLSKKFMQSKEKK